MKNVATRSARDWIGAIRLWASSTRRAILATKDSDAGRVTLRVMEATRFRVPAETSSPAWRNIGIGSPVIVDSSSSVEPSSIRQSTGILSPGLTSITSPATRLELETTSTLLSLIRVAFSGASCKSLSMLEMERLRAELSKSLPSRIRVMIIAAVSK